jgi:hypothetical protein
MTHPKSTWLGSARGLGGTLGFLAGIPFGAAVAEISMPKFFETLSEHPYMQRPPAWPAPLPP